MGILYSFFKVFKPAWDSVMSIEHSPLSNLPASTAHMVFQALAFMWSGIFGLMLGSVYVFGVSAILHALIILGFGITFIIFRRAEKTPESFTNFGNKDHKN